MTSNGGQFTLVPVDPVPDPLLIPVLFPPEQEHVKHPIASMAVQLTAQDASKAGQFVPPLPVTLPPPGTVGANVVTGD